MVRQDAGPVPESSADAAGSRGIEETLDAHFTDGSPDVQLAGDASRDGGAFGASDDPGTQDLSLDGGLGEKEPDAGFATDSNSETFTETSVPMPRDSGATFDAGSVWGCGGLAPLYRDGLVATGEDGLQLTMIASDPSPPRVGANVWTFRLAFSDGAPSSGASVTFTPYMPQHGHGSPVDVHVVETGEGVYEAAPVLFSMPGYWQMTVLAELDAGVFRVLLDVCVE